MKWTNFIFSITPDGEFSGRERVDCVGLVDKSNKLRINNTSRRMEEGKRDMICVCPDGNLLCYVCLLKEFKSICHPDQQRIYCYKAGKKKIAVSI